MALICMFLSDHTQDACHALWAWCVCACVYMCVYVECMYVCVEKGWGEGLILESPNRPPPCSSLSVPTLCPRCPGEQCE
jgi:hypothetical protein